MLDVQDVSRYGGGPVRMYNGTMAPAERAEFLRESFAPFAEDFVDQYGWDADGARKLCEAFSRGASRFSFRRTIESINDREIADGKRIRNREAITTSQSAAAISLIIIHSMMDTYAQTPAIFRELAEVGPSNGDSEVYPESFMDDLPVLTAETEPAPESRMGNAVVRIKNYPYTRALAISKRLFELDKTGMARRWASNFGSKYPIMQDRAFVLGIFRAGQYAQMTTNGGLLPPTNIAGGLTLAGSYASGPGLVGVPDGYTTTAGQLTPQNIENALLAPALFVDPYGVEIGTGVEYDTLLCDSLDRFKAKRFVQSNVNPVQLLAGDTTGQAPGAFTDNVLKGEFTVASSPYIRRTRAPLSGNGFPWAMLQRGQSGIVMQIEKEWDVQQELPNAGLSFDEGTFRWRGEGRFGTGMTPDALRRVFFGN